MRVTLYSLHMIVVHLTAIGVFLDGMTFVFNSALNFVIS